MLQYQNIVNRLLINTLLLNKLFHIYRSSAGSGKTRTLAKEYLTLALRFRADYFKHILAVTFTNKATQEMKDRILSYLDDFANSRQNELADDLKKELNLDDPTFRQYAHAIQSDILHQYAQFSISTIDAFFQKVIRAFTREAGLMGDYRLEVEQDNVLEEVIDNLIDELGSNKELTEWVVEFAKENLENERAWDIRYSLIEFAKEIFREEFKEIEEQVVSLTSEKDFFKRLRSKLWEQKNGFLSRIEPPAKEAIDIIRSQGWDPSDISYGQNSGLISFFETFALQKNIKEFKPPSDRLRNYFTVAANWPSKTSRNPKDIVSIAQSKLIPILQHLIELYDNHFTAAISAEVVLQNLYVFGLIADISRKLKEYKDENNLMLLADAPKFLNGVIQDSDTPFIYEKVGSFYKNYLIDEFQDTSAMQWKNFLPLLINSMDQGHPSLVVGDVKQAIYRWRGGDLKLLQQEVEGHIGKYRTDVKELNSNFRSASAIVNFNNIVFKTAASSIALETGHPISTEAYHDVNQQIFREEEGFLRVKFLEDEEDLSWKERALNLIPIYLEELQGLGIALKDIAILVRKNEEGQQIVAHLLQYKNSEQAKPGYQYDVVSNESLRIDGASTVNLLLGAMRYLLNPDDVIARAQLGYEFARLHEPQRPITEVFAVANQVFFESNLPPSFAKEKSSLKKLPLFELTETLIEIFKLGEQYGELAYLQAFQNLVLNFYSRERNDLGAFLEWWENNRHKHSVQVSGEVNAVQILTVHKSKGLQFKYVLIPFCFWNLDHDPMRAPNLWVTSEKSPFNQAGFLPVKYSSTLEKTFFDDYYQLEHTRSYLDNLNLLYVALTRAEKGMIVMVPHPTVRNVKKSAAHLLYTSITLSELSASWNDNTQEYNAGTWQPPKKAESKDSSEALSLKMYPSHRWRDKLVIRQSAKTYFNPAEDEKFEKITFGIHLHTILSRIKYASEIAEALEGILLEGYITQEEKAPLLKQLQELLNIPQVAAWFKPDWEVRTEVPILLPEGTENRIDRLMIKDKKVIIVDFKTGDPMKSDQRQVLSYIEILRKMNFVDIEGYLLYIKDSQVVSVMPGKVKVTRKKDENQLGLGF
ncbi:MAG TPA: UvrD-helicase domain-containing protein [Chryseolinea sp.]|nr:UvrD-helicase domain-containing protein [Chryseolinea sp.]